MKKIFKYSFALILSSLLFSKIDAQIISAGISITIAPPVIPVYTQPLCPNDGYLWEPGYWAYGPDGYYWVPGVWVAPPMVGYLWTPGYWGFAGGFYGWHSGYWGPHVGYYGGINYGFGYGGIGFGGGMWEGNVYRYNTAVTNVNTTVIHNTYINRTVINNTTVNRTSFNGPGGVTAQPTPAERAAMNEHHIQATSAQMEHQQTAGADRNQLATVNHGVPQTTAMNRVGGSRYNVSGHPVQATHTTSAAQTVHTTTVHHTAPTVKSHNSTTTHTSPVSHAQNNPVVRHPQNNSRTTQPQENHPTPQHAQPSQPRPSNPGGERAPARQQERPMEEHPHRR